MSVEPGFGGQKFIPTTPTRIAAICAERTRRGCDTLIEVDGMNFCPPKPGSTLMTRIRSTTPRYGKTASTGVDVYKRQPYS